MNTHLNASVTPDCIKHQPPSYPLPALWSLGPNPRLASAHYVQARRAGWLLWEAYRGETRNRLPDLYLCRLPANGSKPGSSELTLGKYDLYDIGALGNRHDVDIFACDAKGKPLVQPFTQWARPEKEPKRLSNPADGPRVEWDDETQTSEYRVTFEFEVEPGGVCHLWARSYRYSYRPVSGGAPQSVPDGTKPPRQDDDGSPPDGMPGGEASNR